MTGLAFSHSSLHSCGSSDVTAVSSFDIGRLWAPSAMPFTKASQPQLDLSYLGRTDPLADLLLGVLPFLF